MLRNLCIIVVAGFLSGCTTLSSPTKKAFERHMFESIMPIEGAREDGDGIVLWTSSLVEGYRFTLVPGVSRRDFLAAVQRAARKGAIRTRFSAHDAAFDPEMERIVYRACQIDLDADYVVADPACEKSRPLKPRAFNKLALANAYMGEGNPVGSSALIDAIDAGQLDEPALRALYHEFALTLHDYRAYQADYASAAHDNHLLEVLRSADMLLEFRNDDPQTLLTKASALRDLGAYDEASALLDRIADMDTDWRYNALSLQALILDQQGRPEKALRLLDSAPNLSHTNWLLARGDILTSLDRPREAAPFYDMIIAFTPENAEGFKGRACTAAMEGDIDTAIENLTQARRLYVRYDSLYEDARDKQDRQLFEAHLASLEAAKADGERAPMPEICLGYYREDMPVRPRSPMLAQYPGANS